MQTKLTLSIDKVTIEKAKIYAKATQRSLSEIVESYLDKITSPEKEDADSEFEEIVGVIKLPKDFDEKSAIREILHDRHTK